MKRASKNSSIGDIAIIGMACRFPGASDVEAFWQNLRNGVESVTVFTDAELAAAGVSPDLLTNPSYVKARPMLDGIEMFDADFFGISPREAETMDPQHRLFLETAWVALENAGYDSSRYEGAIGMYGGSYFDTYLLDNLCSNRQRAESLLNQSQPGSYLTYLGNDKDYLTSRVAYKLDLKGPAVTVQTACSTSLVAIVQASQSLLYYQCDMALAGGVAVTVPQKKGYLYQEGGMTSPDGHCRPFDAQARGTLFGSGVGLVLLKRLAEAIEDGDNIYAVIKGSAMNNDGAVKASYTAPSVSGQADVIALAQALAGVSADTISYVEAHGTGTPLGDPIEVAALTQAFQQSTDLTGFCGIGSLKGNVGHLDVAAGVAGVMKTALALQHKLIPPTLHFTAPNPKIDFTNSPFYVVAQPTEWKSNGTLRRAGVSAFGVGGTNAHVVMEETPATEPSGASRTAQLLMLSAKTPEALDRITLELSAHLKARPDISLADVAYTLQAGRREMPNRRVLVCRDTADAVTVLEKPDPKRVFTQRPARRDPPVVFMFPGQGSQYAGMGAELYSSEAIFRAEVDRCAEFLLPILGTDLRSIMFSAEDSAKEGQDLLVQTRFTQPALFVFEYALAQLWMSWDIRPAAMIGHSVGEYVAACLAGVFSLEDGLTLIAERARLVQQQPGGAMLAVQLPEHEVVGLIEGNKQLAIAAINTPNLCAVAGPHADIESLEAELTSREVGVRQLRTSHAFHSPMMDPVIALFTEALRKVTLNEPQIPFISNVTAEWITPVEATDPNYWASHLRKPVRFAEGIAQFMQDPSNVLLEVGPGKTLSTLARQHPDRNLEQVVLNSLAKDEGIEPIFAAYGRLWLAGVSSDPTAFFGNQRRKRLPLPTYPFERRRYWVEPDGTSLTEELIVSADELTNKTEVPGRAARTVDQLKAVLTQLSGKDFSNAGDDVTFVELGFESLFLTQVTLAISRRFGVQVAFRQLLGELATFGSLAAYLDKASSAAPIVDLPTRPLDTAVPQTAPLTEAQQEVWLAAAMGDGSSCVFNQSCALRLDGPLRREVLETAVQELVQRHDGLRTVFSADGISQSVLPQLTVDIPIVDLAGSASELDRLLAEEAARPFDLEHGPLVRVCLAQLEQSAHVLLLTVHHIVCDGRSLALLLHDLGELYSTGCQDEVRALPPAESLMSYAVEETKKVDRAERQAAEAYWLAQYAELSPPLDLPGDFQRPTHKSFHGALARLELPKVLCADLKRAGARQGCTLFTTLLAAYYVLLRRLSGQHDVVVGVPFATPGMDASGQHLVGHTVNFLGIRAQLRGTESWTEHLQEVKRLVLEAFENRSLTYGTLTQKLVLAWDPSRIPLVAASFNLAQNRSPMRFTGLRAEKESNPHSFTNLDLTFDFNQDGDNLDLECIYNTDLFDAVTVRRWLGHFQTLLNDIVANPTESLDTLAVLSESERNEQIGRWNDTAWQGPQPPTIHGWFEAQAEKTPNARAVTFEFKHLTYGELNRCANQLAGYLKRLGVGPGVIVGLLVERSLDMVVALLGILKAGGTYVPLDPDFPKDRLAYMMEDSAMGVLITHRELDRRLPTRPSSVVRLDGDREQIAKEMDLVEAPVSLAGSLAYVLYTSGSTGKPKGVEIPHSAVVNFLSSMQREPGFTSADTMLAVTTLSFDISGLELYLPLVSGGHVVIASGDDARDPARLMERIRDSRCTVMQATPATWRALVTAGWTGSQNLKVLCGGESLPRDLAQELLSRCGELWNMYGPTETTIWSTVCRIVSAELWIPIGHPIANTKVLVLDENRNLLPQGAIGELYIGGAGLARGYLHRANLTEERFVTNPFDHKERLYRTGDLARWRSEGTLECLGRADNQVKIRGFRIELGEIETILATHEAIREGVVIAREDAQGDKQLVAYYETKPGSEPFLSNLRGHVEKALPAYMVPAFFVRVEKLPLTPNGKLDRKSLPAPEPFMEISTDFVAPSDPLEQLLTQIWKKVLNVKLVGTHDNFFELGGHSLLAVRVMVEIEKLCKMRLPLATLLQSPTIAALAEILHRNSWAPSWSSLVPIQQGGSRPPLFLMHSHGGNVLEYYPLGRLLGHRQPLYALQSRGLDGQIEKDLTIESMAATYVDELRSFQPEGPYFLGGFCFGGFVALEAAQQLTAAGQEVALVVLIQSMHPDAVRFKPTVTLFDRWRYGIQKRMDLELENLSSGGKGYLLGRCRHAWNRFRARAAIAFGHLGNDNSTRPSSLPMHHILEALAIEHGKAIDKYAPRPYGGDVVLFRASKQLPGLMADRFLGWKTTLYGNLDVCEIVGHQQNLLLEPHVSSLANELSSRLSSAQDRHKFSTDIQLQRDPNLQRTCDVINVG